MSASREKKKRKEEFEQGISKQQIREQDEKVAKKRRKISVTVIVTILVLVIAAFCVVFDSIPFFSGRMLKSGTALEVGDVKFSAADFNFYYYNVANEYSSSYSEYFSYLGIETGDDFLKSTYSGDQTWGDLCKSVAIDNATEIGILVTEANKAGFTLTEEEIADIDSFFSSLSSYATNLGMDIDEYYQSSFGAGVNEAVYRRNMELSTLANNYKEHVKAGYAYSDEVLNEYYEANKDSVDVVDYNYFFMSGIADSTTDQTTEEAMEIAYNNTLEFIERLEAGESYYDLAYEYAREISKERYEDIYSSYRRGSVKSSIINDFSDWLFDGQRVPGEITFVEGNPDNTYQGYFVVQYLARERAEYQTVNYRNISVPVSLDTEAAYNENNSDDEGDVLVPYDEYVEEQWAAGEISINEIVDNWLLEGGDEDAFATSATSKSSDSTTSADGGLNKQVYKYQKDDNINNWIFAPARKTGDYEIVETSSGYELLYFVGYDEVRWKLQITETLSAEDYNNWFETVSLETTVKEKRFGMFYAMK